MSICAAVIQQVAVIALTRSRFLPTSAPLLFSTGLLRRREHQGDGAHLKIRRRDVRPWVLEPPQSGVSHARFDWDGRTGIAAGRNGAVARPGAEQHRPGIGRSGAGWQWT